MQTDGEAEVVGAGRVPVVTAHVCVDARPLKWAKVMPPVKDPPLLGSTASAWCSVTGEDARAVWRAAEAAATGATRRAGGIGLALGTAGPPQAVAEGDAAAHGVRRRMRRSAAEWGTAAAAGRLVAHVTQPTLWEPGVT